jgi:cardiolipin synthase
VDPVPGRTVAKSQPRRWRQPIMPRKEWYRLSPDTRLRRRKRIIEWWDRFRYVIRAWWFWALPAVYLAAIGSVPLAAFCAFLSLACFVFAPTLAFTDAELDYSFSTESAEFYSTMEGATGVPFVGGNRIELLENGKEFYPAMLEAVENAEHSITMEQYIHWNGEVGRRFAEAFARKSNEGVKVKLLLDAVGSATIGSDILKILEDGHCQVAWFRPVRWYSLHRANHRTHRKSLVIDGRIGFTGGAGIADHWLGNAETPTQWRDTQVMVEGPAAAMLQTGFAKNWLATTGELITGARFFPPATPAGRVAVQTILSSPEEGRHNASIMYQMALLCARKYVFIANPYFVPDRNIIEMFRECAKRGVDVKVMLAGVSNDIWFARQNSLRLYGRLLEAGVEIYEYNHTMMHHKTMVVDDAWATIGTANFDNRSFALNEESCVCFYDAEKVQEMRDIFLHDVERCDKVSLEEWRGRGLFQRGLELFSSLVQDQV